MEAKDLIKLEHTDTEVIIPKHIIASIDSKLLYYMHGQSNYCIWSRYEVLNSCGFLKDVILN